MILRSYSFGACAALLLTLTQVAGAQSERNLFDRPFSPLINRTVDIGDRIAVQGRGLAPDKCGPLTEKGIARYHEILAAGDGYFYADLLADIEEWKESPYVTEVRSIGKTVQDRDIWELEITSESPGVESRQRVTIHARTHPHEIQAWWVVENVIEYLLSDDPYAAHLREKIRFHIYPMYNPDGVELQTTRYNANGVDLEREWDKEDAEPEPVALKGRFQEFMNSSQPIKVALNLHSSSNPERYFWFHDPTGTSEEFAGLQRSYIAAVRSYFTMIMPWDYAVSWTDIAPTHFPESWFWYNYGTDVMALTYEDIFSHSLETEDAHFDSAGVALLIGVGDYLKIGSASVYDATSTAGSIVADSRIDSDGSLQFEVLRSGTYDLQLYDRIGRRVADFEIKRYVAGVHTVTFGSDLPAGVYYLRVGDDEHRQTIPLLRYQ